MNENRMSKANLILVTIVDHFLAAFIEDSSR